MFYQLLYHGLQVRTTSKAPRPPNSLVHGPDCRVGSKMQKSRVFVHTARKGENAATCAEQWTEHSTVDEHDAVTTVTVESTELFHATRVVSQRC
jgi:hypothetical protein